MRIAVVAKLFAPIRITSAMGQEKFIYELCTTLAKRGHRVTLFASGDSRVEGIKLIPVVKKSWWAKTQKKNQEELTLNQGRASVSAEAEGYFKTLFYLRQHRHDFDIIHDNSDDYGILGPHKFLIDLPLLSTIHILPKTLQKLDKIAKEDLNNHYIAISQKQKKLAKKIKIFDVVYNGINMNRFRFSKNSQNHLSWIGRIDPNKGLDTAIEVAEKTKNSLRIAGPIFKDQYFKEEIKPKLNKKIRYVGALSGRKLKNFYRHSKAILFPVRWEEPFGLVMVEAMSCGTPIIAFRRGSVPEIVVQGKTGFICPKDKVSSMIKAVNNLYAMSDQKYKNLRLNCRRHVEENFTIEKMVDNYEKVYQKVIEDWKENAQT